MRGSAERERGFEGTPQSSGRDRPARSTFIARPPPPGPPRPRARPGSRAWGGRGGGAREPPGRELRGTPCTRISASRARRCLSPRTPCTCFAASRARICSSPRTPCTCFAASRARRCSSPRTPCTSFAPSRARRCSSPRTPCRRVDACRARRFLSQGTSCSNTLPGPCRARTSRRSPPPRPSADASRGPVPWRNARSDVTRLRRRAPGDAETFV